MLLIFIKLYAHSYQHDSIKIIYKSYYTIITQPRFIMAQPRVIFIFCLYFAKLNPVYLYFKRPCVAQLLEHWTDDLEIAGTSPPYATIFLPTMFACLHRSLQVETLN